MNSISIKLLLVDDEPDLREALGDYLSACGFQVTAVEFAEEALVVAETFHPEVLLTDLSLPDMAGEDFLNRFAVANPGCRLYVHSGDMSFRTTPQLESLGLVQDHIFYKPTDLRQMVETLQTSSSS